MSRLALELLLAPPHGRVIALQGRMTMGRSDQDTLTFPEPDFKSVSLHHAALEVQGGQVRLLDLGSTNGTWVDDQRVSDCIVMPGQIIRLGGAGPRMRVVVLEDSPAVTSRPAPVNLPAVTNPPPGPPAVDRLDWLQAISARAIGVLRIVLPFVPAHFGIRRWLTLVARLPVSAPARRTQSGPATGPAAPPAAPPAQAERLEAPPAAPPGTRAARRAGDYTTALGKEIQSEAGGEAFDQLVSNPARVDRLISSGTLSPGTAGLLRSASSVHHRARGKARRIILVLSIGCLTLAGLLAYQNHRYRESMARQQLLLSQIQSLNMNIDALRAAPAKEAEKAQAISTLRSAERELLGVQGRLKSADQAAVCSTPFACEVQQVMADFGSVDYLVPDDFVQRVAYYRQTYNENWYNALFLKAFRDESSHGTIMVQELTRSGLPRAFFYLAAHESALNPVAESAVGARGYWQFMPPTGRQFGLKIPVDWKTQPPQADERTDPLKSTRAAARFLKRLVAELGDVPLAMLSYNAGRERILGALRKIEDPINHRDFWYVYRMKVLPEETNEYIPQIVATMLIDKNRTRHGFAP